MMAQFERLKLQLDIRDAEQDALLTVMLEDARDDILSYTNRKESEWLPTFDRAQRELVIERYNKMGAEGEQSRSVGSVSRSFADSTVLKELNPKRIIR